MLFAPQGAPMLLPGVPNSNVSTKIAARDAWLAHRDSPIETPTHAQVVNAFISHPPQTTPARRRGSTRTHSTSARSHRRTLKVRPSCLASRVRYDDARLATAKDSQPDRLWSGSKYGSA